MTTHTFVERLNRFGFWIEELEPSEVNVVAREETQTYPHSHFPVEYADIMTDHISSFAVNEKISDKVFLLIKAYADTPLKERHFSSRRLSKWLDKEIENDKHK